MQACNYMNSGVEIRGGTQGCIFGDVNLSNSYFEHLEYFELDKTLQKK